MSEPVFTHEVFLSHSAIDKAVVRPLAVAASRQSAAFSAEGLAREEEDGGALPRRRYAEKIEAGLEHSRVLVLCMSAHAFGSDWAQLEVDTCGRRNLRFRDPLNQARRFMSALQHSSSAFPCRPHQGLPWRNSFRSIP